MNRSSTHACNYIAKLEKLLKGLNSSGLLSQEITMEEHYQLYILTNRMNRAFYKIQQSAPTLRTDRLRVLANHLMTGKLAYKFSREDSTYFAEYPILFPEQWAAVESVSGSLAARYMAFDCCPYDGEKFHFGLTELQHRHLFFSYNQQPEWGGIKLTGRTGRLSLAKHILAFCDHFEKGGCNEK